MAFFITTTIGGGLVTALMLTAFWGLKRKAAMVDAVAAFEPYLSDMGRVLAAGLRVLNEPGANLEMGGERCGSRV